MERLIVWPDLGCRGDHVKHVAADHRIAGELVALLKLQNSGPFLSPLMLAAAIQALRYWSRL